MDEGPLPLEFAITLNQGALETAVQVHCAGRVNVNVVGPPLESKVTGAGVIKGSVQEPAL